jgi:hypothetical protein
MGGAGTGPLILVSFSFWPTMIMTPPARRSLLVFQTHGQSPAWPYTLWAMAASESPGRTV